MTQMITLLQSSAVRVRSLFVTAALSAMCHPLAQGEEATVSDIFSASPSEYSQVLELADDSGNILRTLHVEERAGVDRSGDLVRAPLFFAENECPKLDELAIIPIDTGKITPEIAWQADDVRRGPDGGISRVHLWFPVDLKAGEKRRFHLVRRPRPVAATGRSSREWMGVQASGGELRISTESGPFVWSKSGELRAVPVAGSTWWFDSAGAFPRASISYPAKAEQPAATVVLDRSAENREITWGTGPLFAKIRVRVAGDHGAVLEQEYRIPRHGRELVVTSTLFPGDRSGATVKENRLLEGLIAEDPAARAQIERIPAGIRHALRAEHAYNVTALKDATGSLIAVPLVIGGSNGVWALEKDRAGVSLHGLRNLRRGKEGEEDTLRAFWTEVRLVPTQETTADLLWETYRDHVQPLVAVVEEPGATVERLHKALHALVREMKPVGWRQDAGRARVQGDVKRMMKILSEGPTARDQDPEALLRSARGSHAKLTKNGTRKLRDDEKGRAYGVIDPYHITYTQSAAAALATLEEAPPTVTAVNYAMAKAIREAGGRIDPAGFPYIDGFGRNLNMQLGPVLFGLTAGPAKGDNELVQFYRDLATSLPVQAVFGRGQRPYTSAPATRADQTDYLYQAICDFWLRSTELLANENLSLHPLAYSRYTDCIDVTADQYHGVAAQDKPDAAGQARANFFRGQAHTHRWLGWACAPYIRLLEDPAEQARVGLTEAIHHSEAMNGRWKNWPDLTYLVLADLLVNDGANESSGPRLPPAPSGLKVRTTSHGNELTWEPVNQASEYRVYRAKRSGGPFNWINSPYLASNQPPFEVPTFVDTTGAEESIYAVMSVDGNGRESAWPESP